MFENRQFSLLILEPGVLFANRQFLQITLASREELVPVSNFSGGRLSFRTPGGLFSSQSVENCRFLLLILKLEVLFANRQFQQLTLTSSEVDVPVFDFSGGPFPIPKPRWAVFEPKCWKIVDFRI
jgi:hypothetical protein